METNTPHYMIDENHKKTPHFTIAGMMTRQVTLKHKLYREIKLRKLTKSSHFETISIHKERILQEWSFQMKFIKRAFAEFDKFHMK